MQYRSNLSFLASIGALLVAPLLPSCAAEPAAEEAGQGADEIRTADVQKQKELVIVDASVVKSAEASNAANGHWSFRFAVEQMAPAGMDPGDFVQSWLKGFSPGTINAFPVSDRSKGADALVKAWPKTSGGKLDLAKSPFVLLAITNRLDLGASNADPGEGRLVFGLSDGRPMTVIFEYKLPTKLTRKAWAKRWHELSSLAFGKSYNAALAALTDVFVLRNASPGRPNGSALGQVRSNEIQLALDSGIAPVWSLREFHLGAGGLLTPAPLTKTPDGSLNGSTKLGAFITANAAKVKKGTAALPPEMWGGESLMDGASTTWTFPGMAEGTRKAFAQQTCNGCHAGENPNIDGFYQITPLVGGDARKDGTSRLSPFELTDDMVQRAAVMVKLLPEGASAESEPTRGGVD